jgi:acetyl esterase/lipase
VTPLERLHPDIAALLASMGSEGLQAMRDRALGPSSGTDNIERTDHVVPGEPPVPVRAHRPVGAEGALPCLYWIHGGGYVGGSHELEDPIFDHLCPTLGIAGVAVGYRLAPDTPYPGGLEDCFAGLVWTFEHADELGIDPTRIGIGGRSAGGGLAAALALLARDRGTPRVAFQLLDCPMLDDRQCTPSSRQEGLPIWSRESNQAGWQAYLGALYGTDAVPDTAAPGRAGPDDLTGLPPALVSVGGVDGFVDEDVDYARRLNQAGVPTELHLYPGLPHGYRLAPQCETVQQLIRDQDDWLRRQVHR